MKRRISRRASRVTPIPQAEFDRLKIEAEQAAPMNLEARGLNNEDPSIAFAEAESAQMLAETGEDGQHFIPGGSLTPSFLSSFAGIPQTNLSPPDCHLAVGPNHVLAAVNSKLQVYDKATGAALSTWFTSPNTLFGASLPAGAFVFDPRVIYDHYNGRWIIIFAATRTSPQGSWIMLAASQTNNPLGSYWVYGFDFRLDGSTLTNNWGDYPTLGFDSQAVFISTNQFSFGNAFQYAKVRTLNKSEIYSGAAAQWYDFWGMNNPGGGKVFALQPCVHYRGAGNFSAYFVNAIFPNGSQLTVWTMNNPLGSWSGGTPSLTANSVACKAYSLPPQALEPGATKINTNDTRLLNAIYQNIGGTTRIWTAHTTAFTWGGDPAARSAINWYEIDVQNKSIVQQNTYGASGFYYFFPAIQTDTNRNVFLIFGRSAANEFGSLRQTGRLVGDALSALQGSALVKSGVSAYTGGRWGDYFGICRDPQNTLRIWAIGEYANINSQWGTWICSLKL